MVAFKRRRRKATTRPGQENNDADTTNAGEISLKPAFKTLTLRVLAIIIYMCLGALVFCAIEYKEGEKTMWRRKVGSMRLTFKRTYNISNYELDKYEHAVAKMYLEQRDSHHKWTYYQSLYFVSTVTTTIGYGHLTPKTQAGRLFLIVFAVVGIPLNILALATVGEHITIGICLGISRLSRICFRKRTIRHINIKVMIISITLMVFMLFVGGSLYVSTEDWTYIDSIYYCFVALATIGFGDLVPNDGRPPTTSFGKALWGLRVLYISIGLSLVSTVFTAISNAIEEINALLGWPKKGSKGDTRKQSRNEGEMPGLKGRTMRLPNHLTYRTTVDEMHDNLASVLPMPGLRKGSSPDDVDQIDIGRLFGRNSCDINNSEKTSDYSNRIPKTSYHEKTRSNRSFQKKRSLDSRRNSTSKNTTKSTEEALDFELTNQRTTVEIHEKDYKNGDERTIENGRAIGTEIRLSDVSTLNHLRSVGSGPLLTRDFKSINSSENDGYEGSNQTFSESSYLCPEHNEKVEDNCLLDIQAQISDFAYCPPKKGRNGYINEPPKYHEHTRQKIRYVMPATDHKYTGLKINGTHTGNGKKKIS